MPALSPTMETGTLAKWLVPVGDELRTGDLLVKIETANGTIEFKAVDQRVIEHLLVAEGTEDVPVPPVAHRVEAAPAPNNPAVNAVALERPGADRLPAAVSVQASRDREYEVDETPLAKHLGRVADIDMLQVKGTGLDGRIRRGDLVPAQSDGSHGMAVEGPPRSARTDAAYDVPQASHRGAKSSSTERSLAPSLIESKRTILRFHLSLTRRINEPLKLRLDLHRDLDASHPATVINAIASFLVERSTK